MALWPPAGPWAGLRWLRCVTHTGNLQAARAAHLCGIMAAPSPGGTCSRMRTSRRLGGVLSALQHAHPSVERQRRRDSLSSPTTSGSRLIIATGGSIALPPAALGGVAGYDQPAAAHQPTRRVAVGRMWQESNDMSPVSTTRTMFENDNPFFRGTEIARPGHGAELGGIVDALSAWPEPPEIIGLVSAQCFPNGRLLRSCHEWLRDEMLSPLAAAIADGGVDAVCISLHGSMVCEGEDDPEGAMLTTIRELVGPSVPIVASLDLHCHLTPAMLHAADGLAFYHTNPHSDLYQTGARAAAVLYQILVEGVSPSVVYQQLPMTIPNERMQTSASATDIAAGTSSAAAPELAARLKALEEEKWCLSAGLSFTQPWLNVEGLGSTVVLTTDGSDLAAVKAAVAAEELATFFWDAKETFLPLPAADGSSSLLSHTEAVAQAHAAVMSSEAAGERVMVVIGDGANATSGGAPGDSGHVLAAMLEHEWPTDRPAVIAYIGPETVVAAATVGEGGTLEAGVTVGAQLDTTYGVKVDLAGAVVTSLFEASFTIAEGHFFAGLSFDMGQACAIRLRNNVMLLATAAGGPLFAAELFQLGGLDPLRREPSLLIANSVNGFRATYSGSASLILNCEAPGCAPPRFYLPLYDGSFDQLGRPARRVFPWDGRESDGGDGLERPLELVLGAVTLEKLRARQEASVPAAVDAG